MTGTGLRILREDNSPECGNRFVMSHVAMQDRDIYYDAKNVMVGWPYWESYILVSCPKVVEALYTVNNKYLSKHDLTRNIFMPLFGKSIAFAETSPEWAKRRKALSPAFYKGKLIKMLEIVKDTVRVFEKKLLDMTKDGQTAKIDIIREVSDLNASIMLSCGYGYDISGEVMDYHIDGRIEKRETAYVLKNTILGMVQRHADLKVGAFPVMAKYYITRHEKELYANCMNLRAKFRSLIKERRAQTKNSNEEKRDLGSILLEDPLFKDDEDMIIDELLTFYFAGSQTTSVSISNLILNSIKQPSIAEKLRQEINDQIVKPY